MFGAPRQTYYLHLLFVSSFAASFCNVRPHLADNLHSFQWLGNQSRCSCFLAAAYPNQTPLQNFAVLAPLFRKIVCFCPPFCGRRDYAVARFRKKMNYLFVRPPPKRRERVDLVRVPRNFPSTHATSAPSHSRAPCAAPFENGARTAH